MQPDLRHFIGELERAKEIERIEGADWDVEIGTVTELSEERSGPALLFDRIKGYPAGYRVVSNLAATPRRVAAILGFPLDISNVELVRQTKDKFKELKPIRPVHVSIGPVLENVLEGANVDVLKFPTPKWHEYDGGRYIGTADLVIMKDPKGGWVNVGTYRSQIHDRQTLGLWIAPGKHGRIIAESYWAQGKPCPVAVCFGAHPLVWIPSITAFPWGVEEWDIVGALLGEPLPVITGELTGLPIPAHAEIAIEGEIPSPDVESHDEGPFGEWPGYYASGIVKKEMIIKVKRIMHRNDPILCGSPPMKPPADGSPSFITRSANLWHELERSGIPGIKGVWFMRSGGNRYLSVISIEQKYGGHAKQVAMAAMSGEEGAFQGRFVIVVDDDIDPSNDQDVLWAVATRCDPATAIDIIDGCWSAALDPIISPEKRARGDYTNSRAIILACRPWYWRKDFPRVNRASDERRARAMAKFPHLFGARR